MAGIYLHIPFCRKACHYCNFHFSTQQSLQEEMVEALVQEAFLRKDEITEPVHTLYFGGGTPSILPSFSIDKIIGVLRGLYPLMPDAEITLEANPDDITKEKAAEWRAMGINRFSIGIQSFQEENLLWMNRAHHALQSHACIDIIREAGFDNFSIDLIYGTPGQSLASWEKDVDTAIAKKIPHLSCYALTIEEGTALHHMIQEGKRPPVNADEQAQCFQSLIDKTATAGYHHYEISNWAVPGFESQHNSAYWEGKPYLGLGPSAHSFDGRNRSWNIAQNIDYIKSLREKKLPLTQEILSETDVLNEYIMTSLRSSKGMNKQRILDQWGQDIFSIIQKGIEISIQAGNVVEEQEAWQLTTRGKFLADGIAASLFFLNK